MSRPRLGAGDVELDLDGERVILRPSLKAAQKLSRQSGGFARAIERVGQLELDAIVEVVTVGLGVEGREARDIPDRVFRTGLSALAAPVIRYLSNLANGGRPVDEDDEVAEDEAGNPTERASE